MEQAVSATALAASSTPSQVDGRHASVDQTTTQRRIGRIEAREAVFRCLMLAINNDSYGAEVMLPDGRITMETSLEHIGYGIRSQHEATFINDVETRLQIHFQDRNQVFAEASLVGDLVENVFRVANATLTA